MFYSCPEIVKNEPYNDKADIWALGCVLYEICCLIPPFCTSNMLALATKITQSDYDHEKLSLYSPLVGTVVQNCLIVEPLKRPDIIGVASLIAEKILTYTDSVRYRCNNLEKKLEKEKNRTQKMFCTRQDNLLTNRSSLNSYQSQMSKASNETELEAISGSQPNITTFDGKYSAMNNSDHQAARSNRSVTSTKSEHNRSSSITVSSPSSSRKNSESNTEAAVVVTNVGAKPRIPTPSQPVTIAKNQSASVSNQVCYLLFLL